MKLLSRVLLSNGSGIFLLFGMLLLPLFVQAAPFNLEPESQALITTGILLDLTTDIAGTEH